VDARDAELRGDRLQHVADPEVHGADGDTDDEREQEEGDRRERPAGCDPADANGGCLGGGRLH
jgi:hypothetical protein